MFASQRSNTCIINQKRMNACVMKSLKFNAADIEVGNFCKVFKRFRSRNERLVMSSLKSCPNFECSFISQFESNSFETVKGNDSLVTNKAQGKQKVYQVLTAKFRNK